MRISGFASGLDIDQMVKDLMKAERMPVDRLIQERQVMQWQQEQFRDLNLELSKFRDDYSKMRLTSTYNSNQGESADSSVVTSSASAVAVPGTYNVEVHSLAKVASLYSNSILKDPAVDPAMPQARSADKVFDFLGKDEADPDMELEFQIANDPTKIATLTITADDNFLSLADKISALTYDDGTGEQVSAGLRASFDNTTATFMISTRSMGADQTFEILEPADPLSDDHDIWNRWFQTGHDGSTTVNTATGADGSITFDGNDVDGLTKNTVTVHGVELNLVNTGITSVSVSTDPEAVFDTVVEFINSYNEMIEKISSKTDEERYRGYPPLTDDQKEALSEREVELWEEKAQSGLLRHDPMLRNILDGLRRSFADPVDGIPTGELNQLSQIGITTGSYQTGGTLFIDEDDLRAAIEDKPDQVLQLFTHVVSNDGDTDEAGLGRRIYEQMNDGIKALQEKAGYAGSVDAQSTLGKQIYDINDEIERSERRMQNIEDRYWKEFTAFEKAMDELNKQSEWIYTNLLGGGNG